MKTYDQVRSALIGAVDSRKDRFAKTLGIGGSITETEDAFMVAQISTLVEVLGNARFNPMLHRLEIDEPQTINVASKAGGVERMAVDPKAA